MPWWESCFLEPILFQKGRLKLSMRPGLGLEWDEKAIARYLI